MSKLDGKVAVVTGASKGIGAAIAKALAAEGAGVVVNYAGDREGADRTVAAIEAAHGKAIAVQGSVAVKADVVRLFDETKKAFGRVDILVNNAGVYQFVTLENVSEAEFHREFDTNVLGMLLTIQEAARHFGPEGASIINVTSIASTSPLPGMAIYSATKGAVDALTRVLAAELGPRKIRVNGLAPGLVETEGTTSSGIIGSEAAQQMEAAIPLGRIGQPDDIAKVVVFLASDEAAWITGDRIVASGGQR